MNVIARGAACTGIQNGAHTLYQKTERQDVGCIFRIMNTMKGWVICYISSEICNPLQVLLSVKRIPTATLMWFFLVSKT